MVEFSLLRYGSWLEPCIYARNDEGMVSYGLVHIDATGKPTATETGNRYPNLGTNDIENSESTEAENIYRRGEPVPEPSAAFFDPFHLATIEDVVTLARYEQSLEALRTFAASNIDIVEVQHYFVNDPTYSEILQELGMAALESD